MLRTPQVFNPPGSKMLLAICLFCAALTGCASLPSLEGRQYSSSISEAEAAQTALGQGIAPLVASHEGKSGIQPLLDAHDAFAARVLLARAAERTLDIQYYIWRNDLTGTLLFETLHAAADRGVRVRLLLDDNNTSGMDKTLAILDSHANIEVRLFNPFLIRSPRLLGFITDFSRANRRMHNKSWTADNLTTIIGGRNIGDEYFGATDGVLFTDLDVLAVGPVVNDVSNDFDRYWQSASSYPLALIVPAAPPSELARLAETASLVEMDPAAAAYVNAMKQSDFIRDLIEGKLNLEWAVTKMVSDPPAKGLGTARTRTLIARQMSDAIGDPNHQLDLVSPYFVPTASGVDNFVGLSEQGVRIRILTNSLDATDVAAVHSGYAKHRRDLLTAGINLYEMRRLGPEPDKELKAGPFGSSGSSLHAKTFAVDRERVFVGSFNFDPRSERLNTELGFIIDSPLLAQQVETTFLERIPLNAYEVKLTDRGKIFWLERHEGEEILHFKEPRTSVWKRALVKFLSILPIESLL